MLILGAERQQCTLYFHYRQLAIAKALGQHMEDQQDLVQKLGAFVHAGVAASSPEVRAVLLCMADLKVRCALLEKALVAAQAQCASFQ